MFLFKFLCSHRDGAAIHLNITSRVFKISSGFVLFQFQKLNVQKNVSPIDLPFNSQYLKPLYVQSNQT